MSSVCVWFVLLMVWERPADPTGLDVGLKFLVLTKPNDSRDLSVVECLFECLFAENPPALVSMQNSCSSFCGVLIQS